MKKAALYIRSSNDRADITDAVQRAAPQELATSRGFIVVAEYSDKVESGADANRPGFQALYDALRDPSRGWDTILTLDTSRLSCAVFVRE